MKYDSYWPNLDLVTRLISCIEIEESQNFPFSLHVYFEDNGKIIKPLISC